MRYVPAIDGLRAIAVLAVVAYHAGLPVPAGFVGVDVFFVISGYLITGLLAREYRETGRIDFMAFYARRVRRILPALLVVVGVTLAVGYAILPDWQHLAKSAVAGLAVAANFFFQSQTGGYFDSAASEMPLLHLWSLSVEEQFYFTWPLLLLVLIRKPVLIVLLGLGSLALAQHWIGEAAFYQMPARFWELAVGGWIALRPAVGRSWLGYAGLAVLGVAVMVPFDPFPGIGAVPAVAGSALVIHALHGGADLPPLRSRPMVFVGLISYSLYLWHWPLLAMYRATSLTPLPLPTALALCAIAFVLAWLSWRFVETPFRRVRAPKLRIIATGLLASVVLMGCAMLGHPAADPRLPKPYPNGACHAELDSPVQLPPPECGTGPIVVWGDSHAFAWRPYAETLGQVTTLTRAVCPPSAGNPQGNSCERFNALAVERAKQADTVILAAHWLSLFGSPREAATRAGMQSAVAALKGRRIIVMGPIPQLRYDARRCIETGRLDECAMPRAEFDRKAAAARAFLSSLPVEYVEPAGFFCTATTCPVMKDGYSLYLDSNHISMRAAREFQPIKR